MQSGIKCVIVASAMRAVQGPCEPIKGCVYAKLESNSEPERARVCRRVAVRASESHREPARDRERSSKSQREPQREPVRSRLNKTISDGGITVDF